MNNSNNQRSSTPPPPPSYDESQREVNMPNNQNSYQQPLAPQTSAFSQSTPNTNYYNTSASSSAPFFNQQTSQPSVPSASPISLMPSAPPQPPQTWPPMDTTEKKTTKTENKLTKAIDKLDYNFNLTGTSNWESNFAYHQNRNECMFSGQSAKIEWEMDKFEKQCSSQGDKFNKDVDELSSKWSSSWEPQSLSGCAQSKKCECSYNDRGVSCGTECKRYPVASASSSNFANSDYYDNSMRKN